ncbi:MAG: hypothetical protein ACK4IS_04925 [Erythrobacter sp.]
MFHIFGTASGRLMAALCSGFKRPIALITGLSAAGPERVGGCDLAFSVIRFSLPGDEQPCEHAGKWQFFARHAAQA